MTVTSKFLRLNIRVAGSLGQPEILKKTDKIKDNQSYLLLGAILTNTLFTDGFNLGDLKNIAFILIDVLAPKKAINEVLA
jgi:hypothetical protein